MTTPLPTPAEVEEMRAEHEAQVVDGLHYCLTCEVSAPCDAARLLALVDSLDRANHLNAAAAHDHLRGVVAARRRLAAVLAECDRHHLRGRWECACGDAHLYEADPQHRMDLYALHLSDRIRRAATGEAS